MSSTGIRKLGDPATAGINAVLDNEQNVIQRMKPFNAEAPNNGFTDTGQQSSTQPSTPGTSFLEVTGGAIQGAFATAQQEVEIVTGSIGKQINIFKEAVDDTFASYLKLTSATADDVLENINGGDYSGQQEILQGLSTGITTIKNAATDVASNIILPGTQDIALAADQIIEFIFDPFATPNTFQGGWRLKSSPGGQFALAGFTLSANQTTNSGTFDFDTIVDQPTGQTLISLVSPGIAQLAAGTTYIITASIAFDAQTGTGIAVDWITEEAPSAGGPWTPQGLKGRAASPNTTTNQDDTPVPESIRGIITPATDVFIRITYNILGGTFQQIDFDVSRMIIQTVGGGGGGGGGGSSGVSFPIIIPEREIPSASGNIDIDLSSEQAHYTSMTLTGDVTLNFINAPASSSTVEQFTIDFLQDATGGHTVTYTPTMNSEVVPQTSPDSRTIIIYQTRDAGTSYDSFLSAFPGNVTGGEQWSLFPAVSNVDIANFNINNVGQFIDFNQAGQFIESLSDPDGGLGFNVNNAASGQAFKFIHGGTEIGRFDSAGASGPYFLDMLQHRVDNVKDLLFSGTETFVGSNYGIGVDSGNSNLQINVPSGQRLDVTVNDVEMVTTDSSGVTINPTNSPTGAFNGPQLQLNAVTANPSVVGQFTQDGTDVFVFSGGQVRNLSEAGEVFQWTADHDANNFSLLNFNTLRSNAANIPLSGKIRLGNNELLAWLKTDNVTSVSFGVGSNDLLSVLGGDLSLQTNKIQDVPTIDFNSTVAFNAPSGIQLDLKFATVVEWSWTASNLSGKNIILDNTLTINDSSAVPIANGNFSRDGGDMLLQNDSFQLWRASTGAGDPATMAVRKLDDTISNNDNLGSYQFKTGTTGAGTIWGEIEVLSAATGSDASRMLLKIRSDNSLSTSLTLQGDDNNSEFILGMAGQTPRIAPITVGGVIGHFVTDVGNDFLLNIGTAGSLEIPFVFFVSTPSLTDLNQRFGAFDGAMGHDINADRLYIRKSSTEWSYWARDGSIT